MQILVTLKHQDSISLISHYLYEYERNPVYPHVKAGGILPPLYASTIETIVTYIPATQMNAPAATVVTASSVMAFLRLSAIDPPL